MPPTLSGSAVVMVPVPAFEHVHAPLTSGPAWSCRLTIPSPPPGRTRSMYRLRLDHDGLTRFWGARLGVT